MNILKSKEFLNEISIFKDEILPSYGEGKKTWEKMLETMTSFIISSHYETVIDDFQKKVRDISSF